MRFSWGNGNVKDIWISGKPSQQSSHEKKQLISLSSQINGLKLGHADETESFENVFCVVEISISESNGS